MKHFQENLKNDQSKLVDIQHLNKEPNKVHGYYIILI